MRWQSEVKVKMRFDILIPMHGTEGGGVTLCKIDNYSWKRGSRGELYERRIWKFTFST
jgi:hypothetical protein|eukprot:COSAG06_NODE_617_length_13753_cov_134.082241_2_plen_58_part_00